MESNYISCRFCDWKTKRWTKKAGKAKHGGNALENHVSREHSDQYFEIIKYSDEERYNYIMNDSP